MTPGRPGDPSDLTAGMRGTGVVQHIPGERLGRAGARLDEAVRLAAIGGDHVWTVVVAHLVTDPAAALGGELQLDVESMVVAGVGCYRCEEPYSPQLRHRRCKGEA